MYVSRTARYVLAGFTTLVLLVLYFPILYIARLSINKARSFSWPPQGFTLEWWRAASHATGPREALFRSLQTALLASAIALVLGTLASFALTLGDFYMTQIVGGTTQFIGNVVYREFSANLPFAAAYATLPIVIMLVYLAGARSSGALEEL